jgi:hypothetical protein
MSSSPTDMKLYEKVKKDADKVYKRDGLYKSAYIQKKYQELGGTYTGKKPKNPPITQWFNEKWVDVSAWLKGKNVPCGSSKEFDGCRPLIRINDKTPITLPELKEKFGLAHIKNKVAEKKANPDKMIKWGVR